MLENNIQAAINGGLIDLDDAIDLREISNIKLANQLLKLKRKKKQERDQKIQQENIQAQAQANAQAQQVAAQAEVQKQQALIQLNSQMEQIKANLKNQSLEKEAILKKELMTLEFEFNMKLKGMEVEGAKSKEQYKEDRKDDRTKIQATQASELIEQRKNDSGPKNFESSGNDIMGGGFGLGAFEPK